MYSRTPDYYNHLVFDNRNDRREYLSTEVLLVHPI